MKKLLTALISVCLLISVAGCGNNAELEQLKKENEQLRSQLSDNSQNSTDTDKNKVEVDEKVVADAAYTLTAGDYEIPTDVAEGKYDVTCIHGNGVFNVHDQSKGYVISETMNITGEYGITERKNATLTSGQNINITGTLKVILTAK